MSTPAFFTSDTHFSHALQAKHRDFLSVEDMDRELVKDWNSQVSVGASVYHLGDLSFASVGKTIELVAQLNGNITLVPGNHDRRPMLRELEQALASKVQVIAPLKSVKVARHLPNGENEVFRFVLCHFPMLVWDRAQYGAMHLHGHCHGSLMQPTRGTPGSFFDPLIKPRMLDVGVDCMYKLTGLLAPMSLDMVLSEMEGRGYIRHDHHKERALL